MDRDIYYEGMEIVRLFAALGKPDALGWRKSLSVVRCRDRFYYHIGVLDADGNLKKPGTLFTEHELHQLLKELSELDKEKCLELKKFERDYMQQCHNGPVEEKDQIERGI